jgi:predicted small lipoprotein YifL
MLLTLCGLFLLGACGQEGPLYLPGTPSEIQTTVPQQGDAPQETDEDSGEKKEL